MDENWRLYFLQHSSFCSLKNHSVHYCPKIYILTILALSLCDNVFLIPAFWLLIVQLQSLRVGEVWEETVLGEHFPGHDYYFLLQVDAEKQRLSNWFGDVIYWFCNIYGSWCPEMHKIRCWPILILCHFNLNSLSWYTFTNHKVSLQQCLIS